MLFIKSMCKVFCLLGLVVLAVIGLIVFFFAPRAPTVSTSSPSYAPPQLTTEYFSVAVSVLVTVNNPNYLAVKVTTLNLGIYYKGSQVGESLSKNLNFPARKTTNYPVTATLNITDISVVQKVYEDYTLSEPLMVTFKGPATFEVLLFKFTKSISFDEKIPL